MSFWRVDADPPITSRWQAMSGAIVNKLVILLLQERVYKVINSYLINTRQ
jgi:hypothetical protein